MVLPRFKLEQNYDLIVNLKEMGLTDLFQDDADFSGMTSDKVVLNWVSRQNSSLSQERREPASPDAFFFMNSHKA